MPALLVSDVLQGENVRLLTYGYDADIESFPDGVTKDKIHNHAEHFVAQMAGNRRMRNATERPIVCVAHCFGGLVLKRALIYSSEIRGQHTQHLRSIFVSTYGILFLGTPNQGSNVSAWKSQPAATGKTATAKSINNNSYLIDVLTSYNETLQNVDRQFIQLSQRFHMYFFHEGKPTDLGGEMVYIVDEKSSSPTIPDVERAVIHQDHFNMSKFESVDAPDFDVLAEGIQRYAHDAPEIIRSRWLREKAARAMASRAEIEEAFPGIYQQSRQDTQRTTMPTGSSISSSLYGLKPVRESA